MSGPERDFTRLVAVSDPHCGHVAGLTPPGYQEALDGFRPEIAKLQRETWDFFDQEILGLGQIDVAFYTGDMIDGRGERSGGTELVVTDRNIQVDMAEAIVRRVNAAQNRFVYGTGYHTGNEEDFEYTLAKRFGCKITDQAWVKINGLIFHLKHHIGGTSIPHGKGTAAMKDALWEDIWADMQGRPKVNIFLRGHTHRYIGIDDIGPGGMLRKFFCLPALQAAHTKYGGRRLSNIVHFGFMSFDIYHDGREPICRKHALVVQTVKPEIEEM
jgi:hypothetical protein